MTNSTSHGVKRKPPTFQHFPNNRAKVLKKAWVEKQKIKSKWKAEKRKEGLGSRSRIEVPEYSDQEDIDSERHNSVPKDTPDFVDDETEIVPSPVVERELEPRKPRLHPSSAHLHPGHPIKRLASIKSDLSQRPAKRSKRSKQEEPKDQVECDEPSLRDLTREAYSRSTLHTFKSDPLKKRGMSEGGGKNAGRRHHQGVTGRGQPNMKLRMDAMLRKIKQDFA